MEKTNASRAILGGFIATLVMTLLMYAAPAIRMPKMDIAAMLGSMLSKHMATPMSKSWWMGMIAHFIDGTIIFPLIYAYLLYAVLPGEPWVKGLLWGFVLWVLAEAFIIPMMGMGFFSIYAPHRVMIAVESLIGHLIYGALLGAIAGPQAVHFPHLHREKHA